MATILLSAAGAALGSGIGGSVLGLSGSVIGRAVGGTVGRSIDQRIIGSGSDPVESGRVDRFRISAVGYGVPMREVWGRMRVAGEVIWASRFMESVRKTGGGKGSPKQSTQTFSYSVSVAISLCLGEATSVGRIWADGVEIAKNSLNIRFYPGSEDQLPDPKIEAVEGIGFAPSYRGTCYVVIEDLPLSRFGNRVPQFSFEVIRTAEGFPATTPQNIAQSVRAVALIPGSGEYSLATVPVNFNIAPGKSKTANVHSVQDLSDFQLSLEQLTDELPNCASVSLVVSWFGNDLRCGHCSVRPKVEQNASDASVMPWKVSGVTRSQASAVPSIDARPIYGGTPSDQSVAAAINAIRDSGKTVIFYPFILMDQLPGNGLPDPWSAASSQPELPWRGRITLSRAPGLSGSPDQTADAENELNDFLGSATTNDFTASFDTINFASPAEWGYRRFVLHYAHLCKLAGGVDSFCIGSELRSLTQIRSQANVFPMVAALRQLASEVRAILGSATKISYAADWSEYFGYHVGRDVFFHLDPLWADENIDFVGIDNYMPISDWRDGTENLDKEWQSIYNIDYLLANIGGGEGFDWYYDGVEAELLQNRSPIVDLAHGENWVFRYKDIKGWWSNYHHDRIGGVRNSLPSPWLPGTKPIRFTEYGCAALDKATNQPNKFLDAKSSESSLPRASTGERDDFIQMQYLRAMDTFWSDDANNPPAVQFSGTMVDFSNSYVWAWDARPFPEFPGNQEVWSDTVNYARGHWLNGRSTNQQLSAVVSDLCHDVLAQTDIDVSTLYGVVRGYNVDSVGSVRSKLQSLSLTFGFDIVEFEGKLVFSQRSGVAVQQIDELQLAYSSKASWLNSVLTGSATTLPSRVRLSYIEADNDFEVRSVEAAYASESSSISTNSECNILLSEAEAQSVVERWLAESRISKDSCQFSLPKSFLGLSNGDVVSIFSSFYRIDNIEDADALRFEATRVDSGAYRKAASLTSGPLRTSPVPSSPVFAVFLDLPLIAGSENQQAPHIAVASDPWLGPIALWNSPTNEGYSLNTTLSTPAILGVLTSPLARSGSGLWDRSSKFTVYVSSGELSSVSSSDVLNGSNVAAIGDGSPENWEVIQFANANLVAPDTYELSILLRGQLGTDAVSPISWPSGSLFVILDSSVQQINLPFAARGLERFYRIGPSEKGYLDPNVSVQVAAFNGVGLRPYSVSHLVASRAADSTILVTFVRRTRIDGDSWQSSEVPLGEETESYTLQVIYGGNIVREVTLSTQSWIYSPSMQAADLIGSGFQISVAQNSTSFGAGPFVTVQVG